MRTFQAYSLNKLLAPNEDMKRNLRRCLTDFWAVCWMSCAFIDRPHAVFPSDGQIVNGQHHEIFPFEDIELDNRIIHFTVYPGIASLEIICKSKVIFKK